MRLKLRFGINLSIKIGGYAYHLYDVIALDRWENDKNKSFAIFDEDRNEIVMIMQLHLEYKKITDNGNSELRARIRQCFLGTNHLLDIQQWLI